MSRGHRLWGQRIRPYAVRMTDQKHHSGNTGGCSRAALNNTEIARSAVWLPAHLGNTGSYDAGIIMVQSSLAFTGRLLTGVAMLAAAVPALAESPAPEIISPLGLHAQNFGNSNKKPRSEISGEGGIKKSGIFKPGPRGYLARISAKF
jgi:hypothetical protein